MAIRWMRRALREYAITGVLTTINFHQPILEHPDSIKGEVYTNFVELMMAKDE